MSNSPNKIKKKRSKDIHRIVESLEMERNDSTIAQQVEALEMEENWLHELLGQILTNQVDNNTIRVVESLKELDALPNSKYKVFMDENNLCKVERMLLLMVIIFSWKHHDLVQYLEGLGMDYHDLYSRLNQLGIAYKRSVKKLVLTPYSIAKLISGENLSLREQCLEIMENSMLVREAIIITESRDDKTYFFEEELRLDKAYLRHFVHGKPLRLDHTENFKAELIQTDLTFNSLMLNNKSKESLQVLIDYIENYKNFFKSEHNQAKMKKGYVAMFHGYPGTGKTLAAKIIGNETGLPTYRVDLSQVVSKYIGDTEKNLEAIFNKLQYKDCILFFDEADALFGKRSAVNEAKDRYANQEVSYLLQRIEDLDFIVILATNFTNNLDAAFKRRINTYIRMDPPDANVRLKLWNYYFPHNEFQLDPPELLEHLADKFAITGANIHNIIKHVCSELLAIDQNIVRDQTVKYYLEKEYYKEGRNINVPDKYSWERMTDFG